MGGRLRRAVVAACCLIPALAGCSPAEPAPPTATLGTAPPVTPTTDPYAVPPVIDAAYVNRVLEGLDSTYGETLRIVMRERRIPQEVLDRLRAMYLQDAQVQFYLDVFQLYLQRGFEGFQSPPGNQTSTVTKVITATSDCVFVEVRRDYAAMRTVSVPSLTTEWVGLRPAAQERDPYRYNPTPWAVVLEGFEEDRSQPQDPCSDR